MTPSNGTVGTDAIERAWQSLVAGCPHSIEGHPTVTHREFLAAVEAIGLGEAIAALNDGVATLAAIRATSLTAEWADCGPHFHAICGETIVRMNAVKANLHPITSERNDGGWQDIETAPADGTSIQARIPGNGDDNVIAWELGYLDSMERDCGCWVFTSEQEPPDCWTNGACWDVNEDGKRSVHPTHWKPLPESSQ